jgi:hypothetical protein
MLPLAFLVSIVEAMVYLNPNNSYEQLTGTLRTTLLADAIFYTNEVRLRAAVGRTNQLRPMTGSGYAAYKKAAILAATSQKLKVGFQVPQSVIVTELQKFGSY